MNKLIVSLSQIFLRIFSFFSELSLVVKGGMFILICLFQRWPLIFVTVATRWVGGCSASHFQGCYTCSSDVPRAGLGSVASGPPSASQLPVSFSESYEV